MGRDIVVTCANEKSLQSINILRVLAQERGDIAHCGTMCKTTLCRALGWHGPVETFTVDDAPKDFLDPISLTIMNDPVVASDGVAFDRRSFLLYRSTKMIYDAAKKEWVPKDGATHLPSLTKGMPLNPGVFTPVDALHSQITEWFITHGVEDNRSPREPTLLHLPLMSVQESAKALSLAINTEIELLIAVHHLLILESHSPPDDLLKSPLNNCSVPAVLQASPTGFNIHYIDNFAITGNVDILSVKAQHCTLLNMVQWSAIDRWRMMNVEGCGSLLELLKELPMMSLLTQHGREPLKIGKMDHFPSQDYFRLPNDEESSEDDDDDDDDELSSGNPEERACVQQIFDYLVDDVGGVVLTSESMWEGIPDNVVVIVPQMPIQRCSGNIIYLRTRNHNHRITYSRGSWWSDGDFTVSHTSFEMALVKGLNKMLWLDNSRILFHPECKSAVNEYAQHHGLHLFTSLRKSENYYVAALNQGEKRYCCLGYTEPGTWFITTYNRGNAVSATLTAYTSWPSPVLVDSYNRIALPLSIHSNPSKFLHCLFREAGRVKYHWMRHCTVDEIIHRTVKMGFVVESKDDLPPGVHQIVQCATWRHKSERIYNLATVGYWLNIIEYTPAGTSVDALYRNPHMRMYRADDGDVSNSAIDAQLIGVYILPRGQLHKFYRQRKGDANWAVVMDRNALDIAQGQLTVKTGDGLTLYLTGSRVTVDSMVWNELTLATSHSSVLSLVSALGYTLVTTITGSSRNKKRKIGA